MQSHVATAKELVPNLIRKHYLAKFATLVVAVLLVTVGAGLYFQGQVSAELKHEVHSEMQTTAELEADGMHQWVEEYEQNARMLSEFESMAEGGDAATAQMDHELRSLPEAVAAIHYVDLSSGTVESSTSASMEGTSLDSLSLTWTHGSLAFEDASETAVSEGYMNQGQERIAFVSPIEGTDKAVMIVADATERAEHFRNPIEGGYTQVVAADGTVEFAEDDEQVLSEYPGGAEAAVLQAGMEGPGAAERDETGEVVAYAPVEGTDWVVLAHAPQQNAYVLRQAVTRDFAILIVLALAGFVVIGLTIGRNTVTALNGLADRADALSQGDLSVTMDSTDRIDEVADQSNLAADRGEDGSELAVASIEQMDDIQTKTTETVAEIEQLDGEMDRIGDIVDLIDDIAEQTNMLALNASIEAVRAGEAGEGFGVVATEIKSLAEETAQATHEIESLIEGVQDATSEAVSDMREMRTLVSDGADTIDDTITTLDDIVDAVEDANTGVQSINDATDEQAASSQEVVSMVDDVSDLSTEVAGESQNVSAAAEEQAASLSQISESAQRLTTKSADLQSMLEQFETDADGDIDDVHDALDDQHAGDRALEEDPLSGDGATAADGGSGLSEE